MRALRTFAAIVLVCTLVGCLEGKKISDIDDPAASVATPGRDGTTWRLPVGVAIGSAKRGDRIIDGLYPATAANDTCCWLAPNARVLLDVPRGARHATIAFLVLPFPFFERHPSAVTLRIGKRETHVANLVPGVHRITVDVALASSPQARTVAIHAEPTFVPAREGVNADTRELGIILDSIAYF